MEKAQDPCGGQFIRWRHDAHSESAEKFVIFGGVLSVLEFESSSLGGLLIAVCANRVFSINPFNQT